MSKPKHIGQQLREHRMRRKMSQERFAQYLGISQRTLENWEQQRTSPRGYAAIALEQRMKGLR